MKNDGSVEKLNVILDAQTARTKWVNTVPKVMIKFMIVKMT